MGTFLLSTLLNAVKTYLGAAASLSRTDGYNELTEGIHEAPTLQIWPVRNSGTDWTGQTDRLTLGASVLGQGGGGAAKSSAKEYLIYADLYAEVRGASLGEAMMTMVTGIEELEEILDRMAYPLFGLDDVLSFRWDWEHVTFDYGKVRYVGARFKIWVRIR